MSSRLITVRVREDDLRMALDAAEGWWDSLKDAAYGEGYGPPDADSLKMARIGLLAVARMRVASTERTQS